MSKEKMKKFLMVGVFGLIVCLSARGAESGPLTKQMDAVKQAIIQEDPDKLETVTKALVALVLSANVPNKSDFFDRLIKVVQSWKDFCVDENPGCEIAVQMLQDGKEMIETFALESQAAQEQQAAATTTLLKKMSRATQPTVIKDFPSGLKCEALGAKNLFISNMTGYTWVLTALYWDNTTHTFYIEPNKKGFVGCFIPQKQHPACIQNIIKVEMYSSIASYFYREVPFEEDVYEKITFILGFFNGVRDQSDVFGLQFEVVDGKLVVKPLCKKELAIKILNEWFLSRGANQ